MRRTLEAFFRRPSRFLLLVVLLPIIGFGVGYMLPRTYQAQASLWASQRFAVIGATGTESNLLATEAQTQATALNELLLTRDFALEVANQTQLPNTLDPAVRADPNLRDDALVQAITGRVLVQAQGTYLFTITYSDKSWQTAQQVVAAVINSYGHQGLQLAVAEGQKLLGIDQGQLPALVQTFNAAVKAEAQYVNQHPTETQAQLINDPTYAALHADTQQKQAAVQALQTQIAQLQNQVALVSGSPDALFQVIDQPTVHPVSRTRTLLFAGGVGLALALLACAIYLALLVRRDRSLYTPAEVQRATELRVLLQLPALPTSTVSASRRALAIAGERAPARRRLKAPRA